jgi:hypothetical protein
MSFYYVYTYSKDYHGDWIGSPIRCAGPKSAHKLASELARSLEIRYTEVIQSTEIKWSSAPDGNLETIAKYDGAA